MRKVCGLDGPQEKKKSLGALGLSFLNFLRSSGLKCPGPFKSGVLFVSIPAGCSGLSMGSCSVTAPKVICLCIQSVSRPSGDIKLGTHREIQSSFVVLLLSVVVICCESELLQSC